VQIDGQQNSNSTSSSNSSLVEENQLDRYEFFCLKQLKADGLRITGSRKSVIRVLSKAENPMSAKDVVSAAKQFGDEIDLVTVYRILEKFVCLDLIHEVQNSGSYLPCLHFNCNQEKHVMVICHKCGRAEEIFVPRNMIDPFTEYLKNEVGFLPEQHMFQIDGTCASCKN